MGNQIRTTILLAVMTALILWIGQFLGGRQGMVIALLLAGVMNFVSYWYSDKIVLKMYRAREISPRDATELYETVHVLTQRAGLPMPKIFVIPQKAPNAFATGRNPEHAVVAVTEGLLDVMSPDEIRGVLAHELAHVNNRDILIGSVAATMAGAVMMLASMARWSAIFGGGRSDDREGGGVLGLVVMSILAPDGGDVDSDGDFAVREYLADQTGARFAGGSEGLARALEKLGTYAARVPLAANPSTAHMFIVNPLSGAKFGRFFSTHPPLADRIARLRGERYSDDPPAPSDPSMRSEAEALWDKLSR